MIRPEKLGDAIAEHLEKLILEGVLRPGEKLASERDLALKLDVSRPSLREALEKLQSKGLIETSKGGTVVAQFLAPCPGRWRSCLPTSHASPPTISSTAGSLRGRRRRWRQRARPMWIVLH